MELSELKKKLRQLKKLESQIRFSNSEIRQHYKYIWDEYFSTKNDNDSSVKYNMKKLLKMDHQDLKKIIDEYFFQVYYQYYKENGITYEGIYDVHLLSILGLPPDSTYETIKAKFRELAKKYHPDHGGDSGKFIELMDTYKKLIDKK